MSRRFAVLAALLLSCAPFGAHAAPDPVTLTDADRKAFHEQMIANASMRELMEYDPAGFKAFEDGLLNDMAAGKVDENGARKRGYDFALSVRAKIMSAVNRAPDDDYLVFANAQLAAMKTLSLYNTRACYEFVEASGVGEDTSSTFGPVLAAEIEKVGQAQSAAAKAGAKAPVKREPSTDNQAEAAVLSFLDRGGDIAWLKSLSDTTIDKLTPQKRCDNAVKWMEALLAQPKAVSVRLLTTE